MYYIMEKYDSDDQGITLRSINDWFSSDGYECAIKNLEYKTIAEAKRVRSALNIIFNDRFKSSEFIIVTEVGAVKPKDTTLLKSEELPSLTKPEPVTPENIQTISDDELRERIVNGSLVDPKLETTLFPNGRPDTTE